jgi:hypothetical protein
VISVTPEELEDEEVDQFTPHTFTSLCGNSSNICAIWMLDGSPDTKANYKHLDAIKTLQVEAGKKD